MTLHGSDKEPGAPNKPVTAEIIKFPLRRTRYAEEFAALLAQMEPLDRRYFEGYLQGLFERSSKL